MTYYTEVSADSPYMQYKYEETTGNFANTGSLGGSATVGSAVTRGATGIPGIAGGKAVSFNGTTNSYTSQTVNTTAYASGNFSVEMWVKIPTKLGQTLAYHLNSGWWISTDANGLPYVGGGGLTTGPKATTSIVDNKWHHIVVTTDSASTKLYVDGALASSTNQKITATATNSAFYTSDPSDASGTYTLNGTMDEFAFYTTALSQARITAHYNAGIGAIAGGYTAQAMTASTTMPGGTGLGNIVKYEVAEDAYASGSDTINRGTDDPLVFGSAVGTFINLPAYVGPETIVTKKITFTSNTGSTMTPTIGIYTVGSAWSEGTITGANKPATTFVKNVSVTADATHQSWTVDLTGIDTTNGIALTVTGAFINPYSSENATAANRPYVTYTTAPQAIVSLTTTPATASAAMPNVVVSATANTSAAVLTANATAPNATVSGSANYVETAMTANSTMVDPVVIAESHPDATVFAQAVLADADMPQGTGFTMHRTVAADVMTANATTTDATVSVAQGVRAEVDSINAIAAFVKPALVNDVALIPQEADDKYFQRVNALVPVTWWRFNSSASTVTGRVGYNGNLTGGVNAGRTDAPNGRSSVHFDGTGMIEQVEPTGSNADEVIAIAMGTNVIRTTLEFSFRTTKADTFLMAGDDQTSFNGSVSPTDGIELNLVGGKINYRQYGYNTGNPSVLRGEFTGFKNLADGEWHHVVIRSGAQGTSNDYMESGVEIMIDGQLEIRRHAFQSIIGFPDYVGSRPQYDDAIVFPALPSSRNFVGDMAEIVWYGGKLLTRDDVQRNYYAFMGYEPIEVQPIEAFAFTPDGAKGKGNQQKALYLYWTPADETLGQGGLGGGSNEDSTSYDPMPGFVSLSGTNVPNPLEPVGDFFGFKVFAKNVRQKSDGSSYRDPVTDDQTLIDLTRDIDLSEYDMIMFKDWPDESIETDWVNAVFPGQKERLLNQLRDANDMGVGLYVTNPRLAVDLGIVDRIEYCPSLQENRVLDAQGNAAGEYDYATASEFPWNIDASDGLFANGFAKGNGEAENTDPNYLDSKAYFYFDTHKNNRFRVRALVDNLTTIPSYMIEEAAFHVDRDPMGNQGIAYKYLHRMGGLEIGDEYIFNGSSVIDPKWLDIVERRYNRFAGAWATPMEHVKAGTVVTTFGATYWQGTELRTNPYKDYATTIIVQPGDMLNGRMVRGKIFCNFTEQPSQGLGLPVQVLPGSEDDIANPFRLTPNDLSNLGETTPLFTNTGTTEQGAKVQAALNRCTFPLEALRDRIESHYGRRSIPIIWGETGEPDKHAMALYSYIDGTITIDENAIRYSAPTSGMSEDDLFGWMFMHAVAHMVDTVYLQAYQRVNIWNMFHGDWNVFHPFKGDYILPANYILDFTSEDVVVHEGWLKSPAHTELSNRIGEAWAQGFVQAYSDFPLDIHMTDPHPTPEIVGQMLKDAIQVGQGAYIFNEDQATTTWPAGYTPDTDAQREWEYSWTRSSTTTVSEAEQSKMVTVTMPNGTKTQIPVGKKDNLPVSMTRTSDLFPIVGKPRFEMDGRGAYWLAIKESIAPGDVKVKAGPMEATAEEKAPVVTAQHDAGIQVGPMLANATLTNAAESTIKDVSVGAFPMEATAVLTGVGAAIIHATPMTATATLVDNFDMVHASGEQVVLTLHGYDATLFIKEEA